MTRLTAAIPLLIACGCEAPGPRTVSAPADADRAPADFSPAPFRFTEERIDAAPGRTLIVPIEFTGAANPDLRATYTARLSDGRTLEATAAWLAFEPAESDIDSPEDQWLPTPGDWSVVRAGEGDIDSSGPGFWALRVPLPPDAAGLGLRIEDRIAPIRWIAPTRSLFPPDILPPRRTRLQSPSAQLTRALLPWSQNPLHRWRINLLGERLALYAVPAALSGLPLDDPVLEALATQIELRWRTALNRLAAVDPPLAFDVLDRLTLIIRLPEGRQVPAWPARSPRLTRFLSDLLDRDRATADLARIAKAWLGEQPASVSWIADDLGERAADGRRLVSAWAANLTGEPAPVTAQARDSSPTERREIPPRTAARLLVPAPPDRDRLPIRFTIGAQEATLLARTSPIHIEPPGAMLGPFLIAWTMPDWLEGAPRAAPTDRAAAAICQPDRDGAGWEIYLECRSQSPEPDAATGPADVVRLFLGPADSPRAILQIDARGVIHDEADPFSEPAAIEVHRRDDRWIALVPIPEKALEPGGDRLIIGLLRRDAKGRLSSWPRPVLPWRDTPGRAAIDLSTWRSLAERRRPASD